MTVSIIGQSDDLIEVDGDITEEFNVYGSEDGSLLACSDGTVLRIVYGAGGVWRITPVVEGSAALRIRQAPEDNEDEYTDEAVLDGDVRWVVLGKEIAR